MCRWSLFTATAERRPRCPVAAPTPRWKALGCIDRTTAGARLASRIGSAAPRFHPPTGTRPYAAWIGVPTVFNLLGPMVARPENSDVGDARSPNLRSDGRVFSRRSSVLVVQAMGWTVTTTTTSTIWCGGQRG